MMETNLQKRVSAMIAFCVLNLEGNCKNSFRVYACCFVNNTVTHLTCLCVLFSNAICLYWPECKILFFNFGLLHSVHSSWPDNSTKIIERRLDTSAIEQIHGFSLFLACRWMKVRDIPAGLRQSLTSLVYKLCIILICFFSPIKACILRILSYKLVNFWYAS